MDCVTHVVFVLLRAVLDAVLDITILKQKRRLQTCFFIVFFSEGMCYVGSDDPEERIVKKHIHVTLGC